MFTGLVEDVGRISGCERKGAELHLLVESKFEGLALGESIAVNGVCLTVDALPKAKGTFSLYASKETLDRTTLGSLRVGSAVNLERALLPTTRMGGHIVTGHVDAVGRVESRAAVGNAVEFTFELPAALAAFVAEKGSVAVDGVSLTVNRVTPTTFSVLLIPHTQSATNLGARRLGDAINIEVDVLARYAARIIEIGVGSAKPNWAERLVETHKESQR